MKASTTSGQLTQLFVSRQSQLPHRFRNIGGKKRPLPNKLHSPNLCTELSRRV